MKISFPCVWRFVSEFLNSTVDKNTVVEIMVFLRNSLLAASESHTKGIVLLENLKRFKIEKILNKLMNGERYMLV